MDICHPELQNEEPVQILDPNRLSVLWLILWTERYIRGMSSTR
ncbi:MAG TPA: hypothetical protein VFN74_19110 [Chloroflexota bacterium]|jgi:hypothetical protein|nr:hypothetical protein [Chloroflexota bacterium]